MSLLRTSPSPRDPARPPRVLVVIQNMAYRYDRRVQNEANALLAAGIGVTVICPKAELDEPDRHILGGVVVRSYPSLGATKGVLSYLREFILAWLQTARLSWRAHRDEGFDVLQACNPPDTYWALSLIWRLRGKALVYDQHDLCPEVFADRFGLGSPRNRFLHRSLLRLEAATYATASHVVVPNESYREVAMQRGGLPRTRTTVVMSTPDHRTMRLGEPMIDAHAGFQHLVAYVGVMGPQDGVDRLLRTAKVLRDRGRRDIRFVLMGFGDCREQLKQQTTDLDLNDCVLFTGRVSQDELRRWLSAADIGVTPDPITDFTERSTMNKTLEYMACEVPVVATDLKETRHCAGDAAVYVRTEVDMAHAVESLLADPERRALMGKLGRKRIEGELSWDRFARQYVTTMSAVLGLPVPSPVVGLVPSQAAPLEPTRDDLTGTTLAILPEQIAHDGAASTSSTPLQ